MPSSATPASPYRRCPLDALFPTSSLQIFPIAFGLMPLPHLWAFLFFLMLLNLGISSAVSMTSPLILSLCEARGWRTSRLAPVLHLLAYVTGLIYVTRAGNYWLELRWPTACLIEYRHATCPYASACTRTQGRAFSLTTASPVRQ